jgi:hypothetical protein
MKKDPQNKNQTRFLNTQQAAKYLGVHTYTMIKWRVHGTGPAYTIGLQDKPLYVSYDRQDLVRWHKKQKTAN